MGCTGSKQATDATANNTKPETAVTVANPSAEAPAELGAETTKPADTVTTGENSPSAESKTEDTAVVTPKTETAAAPAEEAAKTQEAPSTAAPVTSDDDEALVPKYHIDEFGNKIDDVTGGRVWSAAYYRARKDAEFHAQERGRCFEASKKAFEEDRKKEAKELSEEGKSHGQKMEEANQRAVDEIIKPQQLENSTKIDLHGLLVAEAVKATRDFVKSVIASRGDSVDKLEIITGAGHHSDKAKGPVIKPAIIAMCEEEKWKLVAGEGNEGSFTLYLKDAPAAAETQ